MNSPDQLAEVCTVCGDDGSNCQNCGGRGRVVRGTHTPESGLPTTPETADRNLELWVSRARGLMARAETAEFRLAEVVEERDELRRLLDARPDQEQLDQLRRQKDAAYSERNKLVALLARIAPFMGWGSGRARHREDDATWERDWMTIVFVELPTGQASWHFHDSEQELLAWLPKYLEPWDGHSTEEKYRRVDAALTEPCIQADHECPACGRIQQPCRICGGFAPAERPPLPALKPAEVELVRQVLLRDKGRCFKHSDGDDHCACADIDRALALLPQPKESADG